MQRALDTALFHGAWLRIGVFDCPRADPRFGDSGPAGGHLMVFPRHAVGIQPLGRERVVADHTVATLYNLGQRYRREAIAPYGDVSVYYAFDESLLRRALIDCARDHAGIDRAPFCWSHAPAATEAFLLERALSRSLQTGQPLEAMQVQETTLRLLERLLVALPDPRRRRAERRGDASRRRRLVHHCRSLLASEPCVRHDLPTLARRVGASEFHLCRLFRAFTGNSIHRHLTALRLRLAVDRLLDAPRTDLSRLALDLGFSSHAHFSVAFARFAGAPPSRWIARAAPRESSRILEALRAASA